MLKRIAAAVNKRVEIRFVPKKEKLQAAYAGTIQLKQGSATVPVASIRRPADWSRQQKNSLFSEPYPGTNAFGETPKAAGEDVRAPQTFRIIPATRTRKPPSFSGAVADGYQLLHDVVEVAPPGLGAEGVMEFAVKLEELAIDFMRARAGLEDARLGRGHGFAG